MSRHHPNELTSKQQQAIAALLDKPTVRAAADKLGMSERTLWGWLATPHFKAAYEEERQNLVLEVRNGFSSLARKALTGINDLVDDTETPAAVKLKAYMAAVDRIAPIESAAAIQEQHSGPIPAELLPYITQEELTLIDNLLAQAQARKAAAEMAKVTQA